MTELHLDTSVLLYQQVYDSIRAKVASGEYPAGSKIPSEDQLCRLYDVSRVTVRKAIENLVKDGILVKRRGKGTYVALSIFVETMAGGSFTKSCQQNGVTPKTEVLGIELVSAKEYNVDLSSPMVWRIQRLRSIFEHAVILEVDYFRQSEEYVTEADLCGQPISDVIRTHTGLSPKAFHDCFDIVTADETIAKVLQCQPDTPLLKVSQTVLAEDQQIIYYNEQYILTQRYTYMVDYQ